MEKYVIGVDIGGTKISTGIVSSEGKVIGDIVTVSTRSKEPAGEIIQDIINSIDKVLENTETDKKELLGIGIGSPGPLDAEKGLLLNPPNLPTLHNFNLKEAISKKTGLKVVINNDANVFVLGEACFGAGKNAEIVFGVTLGTGLGSGLVLNKKIYMGATGTACEIWHCKYKDGIIEDYVSGRGIRKIYREITGKEPPLAHQIYELAKKGEKNAVKAWKEFGKHLGVIFSYVVNIVDPQVIVIGGSIRKSYKFFYKEMKKTLKENVTDVPAKKIKVKISALGDSAGVIGAASLLLF